MDRHQQRRRLLGRALPVAMAALICSGCAVTAGGGGAGSSAPPATTPYTRYAPAEHAALEKALADVHVKLPSSLGAPAPSLPADAFGHGLGSRQVIGFLPSWELGLAGSVDYSALSEICYYALQVEARGTILKSGQGWADLEDGEGATLVSDAHTNGVRALLTLYSGSSSVLDRLAKKPSSGTTLANQVAPELEALGFDGVDLDLEGTSSSARAGFVKFVAAFSSRLSKIDHSWGVVLDTYPQSAVDQQGFFDVQALAGYVDDFFVMDYDMTNLRSPAATAPLRGPELSDVSSIASYVANVPASKVIVGIPFYGYDFETTREKAPASVIGDPVALGYDNVVSAGTKALWDPSSETPYTVSRPGGKPHETWFDDPTSVALKVALASAFKTAGVGAWELGMANGTPMTAVLDGGSPPARLPLATQP